ncbi:hypothetical protein Dsin_012341 [Dipteronia sinensis]|uniref:NAC domain-containing protein n=1 Tax=Dipteronia sinensis TaxID=43782 RepID=A0AAE0AI32_9ROSI|nr:hypothetical protein Dsin_012341 [Dipteronia sinensis]
MINSSSSSQNITTRNNIIVKDDEEEEVDHERLPGFRFHPTDEELIGFYLRRKVDKKPLRIELIKQMDIYKFDPWDLPKTSTSPDKEGYFFCKRGRKYRNSIRPNRVTGSGFWKATGIDKQVYSLGGEGQDYIGLKKTLVYYRGSAGKGTKTDWMMHEFRLPSSNDNATNNNGKINLQEAEVWTICRIFKRNVSHRKLYNPDWKSSSSNQSKRNSTVLEDNSSNIIHQQHEGYNINFEAPALLHHQFQNSKKPRLNHHHHHQIINQTIRNIPNLVNSVDHQQLMMISSSSSSIAHNIPPMPPPPMTPSSSSSFVINNTHGNDHQQLLTYDQNWDELRSSVVEFGFDPSLLLG